MDQTRNATLMNVPEGPGPRPKGMLARSVLAMAAVVAGDIAGTALALLLGGSRHAMTITGYVVAAAVAIALLHRMGAARVLRLDRHAIARAIDRCGWLLGINLVLGLLTLMPEGGARISLAPGWPGEVLYILVECALIGVVEESMFRGLLLGGLLSRMGSDRRGVAGAVLICSLVFGLAHVVGAGDWSPLGLLQAALKVVQAGIIGAALATVMVESQELCGPAAVHGLFDFLIMAPAAAIGQNADSTEYVATGAAGVSTALSYVLIIIAYLPMAYLVWQRLEAAVAPDYGWLHAARRSGDDGARGGVAGRPPMPGQVGRPGPAPAAPMPAAGAMPAATRQASPAAVAARGDAAPRGTLITLEGIDGCGKSTQARILADRLRAAGLEVVSLRDPGSTAISESIRQILLDPANAAMSADCELMLYEAARAQMAREVIEPALARGATVICDRFYDSTYAYQYGGRGLDEAVVMRANELGSCGIVPDRTIVLDIAAERALERATRGGADRLESEGRLFEEKVRNAYLRLALKEPGRVRVIDAAGSVDEVASRLASEVSDLFEGGLHA